MKGYKVFNPDWTCRDKQYACPGVFEEDVYLDVCKSGMHFCKRAVDCFRYYAFDPNNHVAEVVAFGDIIEEDNKCCTNKLEIVREIPWEEVLTIVNTGSFCTGLGNSGNYNSGDRNSGYRNSGYRNSGHHNSGDCNSGDCNSGYFNSGDYNSGNNNSGNYNSGDCNSGDFNIGCFNTTTPNMTFFNKMSNWSFNDWLGSYALRILRTAPNFIVFVTYDSMSDTEKEKYPRAKTTGGYILQKDDDTLRKERQAWWDGLSNADKEAVLGLPNFDAEIFQHIMLIDVNK